MLTRSAGKPARKREKTSEPCGVPECGRPAYARGLCQTHHRQMLTVGRVRPIRPYRRRSAGTVKFAGLRLSAFCAGQIQRKANRDGLSKGAAIADIVEEWAERRRR